MRTYTKLIIAAALVATTTPALAQHSYEPHEGHSCHEAYAEVFAQTDLGKSSGAAKSIYDMTKTVGSKRLCVELPEE